MTASRLRNPVAALAALAALAAATLFTACADGAPVGPPGSSASPSSSAALSAESAAASYSQFPDLGVCTNLQVPAGSRIAFHVYATGVQIYHWDGASWVFFNPSADLFADAGRKGLVGTHFGTPAGPAWLTNSGSQVVGAVAENGRCTPNPGAIAWLKLEATPSGRGVFAQTAFIQRVNTVGGVAPSTPGAFAGDEVRVPYTSEYFFYRAQ